MHLRRKEDLLNELRHRFGGQTAASPNPFVLRDDHWDDLAQLEAVVEFFANCDEPWDPSRPPINPNDAISGSAATTQGDRVILGGSPDLSRVLVPGPNGGFRVRKNFHSIYLETDRARPSRAYKIVSAFNPTTLGLDGRPDLAGPSNWRIELYVRVHLSVPQSTEAGSSTWASPTTTDTETTLATVDGNTVTLPGADLADVEPNSDFIEIGYGRYRITEKSDNPPRVTINLPAGGRIDRGPWSWKIYLRPVLVLVDSLGPRRDRGKTLQGNLARVQSRNADETTVLRLEDLPPPDLSRINPNFDSIYLNADTATDHRPLRTYRVSGFSDRDKTVTVKGLPQLDRSSSPPIGIPRALTTVMGGRTPPRPYDSSPWCISSGVGGGFPPLGEGGFDYDLRQGLQGCDHYEGVMFVVYGGEIKARFEWSSYTSRNYGADNPFLSSIRGNRCYRFFSQAAGDSDGINYAFRVHDWGRAVDAEVEGRYYFKTPVEQDTGGHGDADSWGKTEIFIHQGRTNTAQGAEHGSNGSAGCLVSGLFTKFRDAIIDIYQEEYRARAGARDTEIDKIFGKTHEQAKAIYTAGTLSRGAWEHMISGTLWLIRPDERPVG